MIRRRSSGVCLTLVLGLIGSLMAGVLARSQVAPARAPTSAVPTQPPAPEEDDDAAYEDAVSRRIMMENCLICHEESMITSQRLTPIQWKAEVEKMVTWGAPLAAEARQPLIDFLTRHFSDREPPPPVRHTTLGGAGTLEIGPELISGQSIGRPASGRGLYLTNCANCHGDAALGGDLGPSLVRKAILGHPAAYHGVVREGLRRMPGLRNLLSREQEEDLLAWLRSVGHP